MQWTPTRSAGLDQLSDFLPRAGRNYADTRNYDNGTQRSNVSQLSPWLHAGLLSQAEVCAAALEQHGPQASEQFVAEVFWRVYFKGYLEQRPSVWTAYCKDRGAALSKLQSSSSHSKAYDEAVRGNTGIEAFDHWARELVETGYLHNHARMWFASIWIFTLKLDWQLGADFFLRHLIDGDAASNTLSWRWVAGLHTKGKTYLARADNIKRYTANHREGPLSANGLADETNALEETPEHTRQPLDLPDTPDDAAFDQPFALLLHDDAASHVPLNLPVCPALVIGAARPDARSTLGVAEAAATFAQESVAGGVTAAAQNYDCPSAHWTDNRSLADILVDAGIQRIALPYLPTGWTRDALWPDLASMAKDGHIINLLQPLNRLTWPHAKAGFFGVKKKSEGILQELGLI